MAKDPAVLFYTSDFLSGVSFMTMEERGKYITLLCEQHQHWSIPENHMINICGSLDSEVVKKFKKDGNVYYNERMREEARKRSDFCKSRSNNKSGRPKKESYDNHKNNHMNNHMENENENINKDVVKDLIPYKKIIDDLNKKSGQNYKNTTPKYRELIKTLFNQGYKIEDFFKVHNKMVEGWTGTQFEHCIRPLTLYSNKFDSYLNFVKPKEKESIYV